jgi:hypothetical protein
MTVFEILTALSPIVLTLVATYIIVKQYQIDKKKLHFQFFEQRYAIFKVVMNYLRDLVANADVTPEQMFKFTHEVSDTKIFFGEEVQVYISELYEKSNRLRYCSKMINLGKLSQEKHSALVEEESEILTWLGKQFTVCEDLFIKYLRIDTK